MSATETLSAPETIEGSGFPLGFRVADGSARAGVLATGEARDTFTVEARQLAGHQKEAVVHEGATGPRWRLCSDEGVHLKGHDAAPFPLGFFNAGLHSDLMNRILAIAAARGIAIAGLEIDLLNQYWLTGSFTRGDGKGHGEPAELTVRIDSPADGDAVSRLIKDAVDASPAHAAMRTALTNTFAIYINGRRRTVTTLAPSPSDDAPDPFRTYSRAPSPLTGADDLADLVVKTGEKEEGTPTPAPAGTTTRIVRGIHGQSRLVEPAGIVHTDTWLGLPGMSHFAFTTDERARDERAPSGLALVSAAIVFCYMTQLSRYIEHMKFPIGGVRIVQYSPYATAGRASDGSLKGAALPVDTHLYLNGEADEEAHERLMRIAADTCYLHATLATPLEPVVTIEHNGRVLG